MIQRKYLFPAGVVLLLVAVWTLGWFWLARVIDTGLQDYAEAQTGDPVSLSWDSVRVTGYPNRLYTHLTRPRGAWSGPDGTITWAGPDTTLKFFTDLGRTVSFVAPGEHVFILRAGPAVSGTGPGGATERRLDTVNEDLSGRMDFDGNGALIGLRGMAELLEIARDGEALTTLDTAAFDWARSFDDATPDGLNPDPGGQTLAFSLGGVSLRSGDLDPSLVDTLGRNLARVAGRIAVRGNLEPGNLSPAGLTRWRDAGGTLELSDFALVWGPLQIAGSGTLAVDDALQPVGAFSARIAGLDRLIDLLERTGRMRPQQAAIARIALAVLTRAPASGGPAEARVPVSIQDRQLSVGPVPLLRLPPIDWN